MENAADALKMAAAVLIFVIALSTAMFGFTKARQAASAVMSKSDNERYYDSDNIDILDSRIVGIETVIPTLYSYFKEGYTILFYTADWSSTNKQISNLQKVTLYYTEALPGNLNLSGRLQNDEDSQYRFSYSYKDENGINRTTTLYRGIYGLDSDDEAVRREPWAGNDVSYKNFIMSLINRVSTPFYDFSRDLFSGSPNDNGGYNANKLGIKFQYQFNGNSPLSSMTTAKFLERQGIYNTENLSKFNEEKDIVETDIKIEDSIIEFEGDISAENSGKVQKKVIQYIYLKNF